MSAAAPDTNGRGRGPYQPDARQPRAPDSLLNQWEGRYEQAKIARKPYEPDWELCQAFLAGRQWVGWDTKNRRVISLPNPQERERHTANVIAPYLWTFKGKVMADDFRPDLRFRRDDAEARGVAQQAQKALEYAWDEELEADARIDEAVMEMLTFGLGGLRVRPDFATGKLVGEMPIGHDGLPIMDVEEGHEFVAEAQEAGDTVQFQAMREGRLAMDVLSPFNVLPPPGVKHERLFRWLILEEPYAIEELELAFPEAEGLKEEPLRAMGAGSLVSSDGSKPTAGSGKLHGHVLLRCGFQMPNREYPSGQHIYWTKDGILGQPQPLEYDVAARKVFPVRFFKFRTIPGRFWPQGVIEPAIGPQRQRNRARSQMIEAKDRNLGRVYAREGSIDAAKMPTGKIMEVIEIRHGEDFPQETSGIGPGPWIAQEAMINDSDLDRVMGLGESSRGGAVPGVSAYSAYALMAEQDDRRVGPIIRSMRIELAQIVKIAGRAIKLTWPAQKQIAVSGEDEDLMDVFQYQTAQFPNEVYAKIGKGAPVPQSQAAEVQKIFDIFDRSISSGQPLPLDWLYESLSAGQAQPLPKREAKVQQDKMELENTLMMRGIPVPIAPYDNDEVHIQGHRAAQTASALIPGYEQQQQIIEWHIQEHVGSAQQKQAQLQAQQPNDGVTPAPNEGQGGQNAGIGPGMATMSQGAGMGQ